MKIGILETGRPDPSLAAAHGSYPDMFERALSRHMRQAQFQTFAAVDGQLPASSDEADGWVITGSRHGVRDELDWMTPLMAFIRQGVDRGQPLVGVCFGHQILAEALGGRVEKAEQGWGLGVQAYRTHGLPDWMGELGHRYTNHAVHQDQVVRLPSGATVLASSDHCPYAAVAYGDIAHPAALSVQSHPEFELAFMEALVPELVGDGRVSAEVASEAALGRPVDNAAWHQLMASYLSRR